MGERTARATAAATAACLAWGLASCSAGDPETSTVAASTAPTAPPSSSSPSASSPTTTDASASASPSASGSAEQPAGPRTSDGKPARAWLTIQALGLRRLVVVPYRGRTDDAPGTAIQNRGRLASPHGPRGGTGPGGVGNYQVTGHRLSSTQPFRFLPWLRDGAEVVVETARRRFVYRVVDTRRTSFRSAESLRRQRAAVPGQPGVAPTRARITLSTCATLEDHAAGNYWSDRFDNPEHRIDKIGVLVRSVRR